jgi:hypothetical protein
MPGLSLQRVNFPLLAIIADFEQKRRCLLKAYQGFAKVREVKKKSQSRRMDKAKSVHSRKDSGWNRSHCPWRETRSKD